MLTTRIRRKQPEHSILKTVFPLQRELNWGCYFFKRLYLLIFRETGREREKEGEKQQSVASLHTLGTEPTTRAGALTRNGTDNLSLCGTTPKQLSHTGPGDLQVPFGHSGNNLSLNNPSPNDPCLNFFIEGHKILIFYSFYTY